MANLQFKRGLKANLPSSETVGTPLWCTDTKELYIGTGSGVEKVGTTFDSSSGTSSDSGSSSSTTTSSNSISMGTDVLIPVNSSNSLYYGSDAVWVKNGAEYTKANYPSFWNEFFDGITGEFESTLNSNLSAFEDVLDLDDGYDFSGTIDIVPDTRDNVTAKTYYEIVVCIQLGSNVISAQSIVGHSAARSFIGLNNGYLVYGLNTQSSGLLVTYTNICSVTANSKIYIKYSSTDAKFYFSTDGTNWNYQVDTSIFTGFCNGVPNEWFSSSITVNNASTLLDAPLLDAKLVVDESYMKNSSGTSFEFFSTPASHRTKLTICSYTTYSDEVTENGYCNKFALDITNEKFKVPTVPDIKDNGRVLRNCITKCDTNLPTFCLTNNSYSKQEIDNVIGNIETLLQGI